MAKKLTIQDINPATFPLKRYGELKRKDRVELLWKHDAKTLRRLVALSSWVAPELKVEQEHVIYWPYTKKGEKYIKYKTPEGQVIATDYEYNSGFHKWYLSIHNRSKSRKYIATPRKLESYWFEKVKINNEPVLLISKITATATRTNGEPLKWERIPDEKWVLFKDSQQIYEYSSNAWNVLEPESSKCEWYSTNFVKDIIRRSIKRSYFIANLGKAMKQFANTKVTYIDEFATWYKERIPRAKSAKELEIEQIKLEDVDPVEKFPNFCYVERVAPWGSIMNTYSSFIEDHSDQGYMVIRGYYNRSYNNPDPLEMFRLYLNDNCKIYATRMRNNKWKQVSLKNLYVSSDAKIANWELMVEHPKYSKMASFLENYEKDIHNDVYIYQFSLNATPGPNIPKSPSVTTIIEACGIPMGESLYKIGYHHILKCLADYGGLGQGKSYVKKVFGGKPKGKKLYEVYGVNKNFLDVLEETGQQFRNPLRPNLIRDIKELSEMDPRYMSKETAKEWLEFDRATRNSCADWYYGLFGNNRWWATRPPEGITLTPEQEKIKKLVVKLTKKNPQSFSLWIDTKNTLAHLPDERRGNLSMDMVRSFEDLTRLHNTAIQIHNAYLNDRCIMSKNQRASDLAKNCAKLYPKRVESYEVRDEKFCVLVPKDTQALVDEGMELHHCVGGYTTEFAKGDTEILFLRRTEDIDTPFYTIEINSNGSVSGNCVIQIHGKYNKWLGNDLDAARFMYRYLNGKGIAFNQNQLTSRGTSYGGSHTKCVRWSEITKED